MVGKPSHRTRPYIAVEPRPDGKWARQKMAVRALRRSTIQKKLPSAPLEPRPNASGPNSS